MEIDSEKPVRDLTVSIVIYQNPIEILMAAIKSVLGSDIDLRLVLIDHSPDQNLKIHLPKDSRVEYHHHPENPGFGAGHNIALRDSLASSRYHLVLNPDVWFDPSVLKRMLNYLDENESIGLLSPKVLYPSGKIQYLCKLLPTPIDAILRRFLPDGRLLNHRNKLYEMHQSNYNKIMDVPYLSGCFMLLRTATLLKSGLFDEQFFMYYEDTDLTRRVQRNARTVFYPDVIINHRFEKGSHHNYKLLLDHVRSAVKYFNKWGWFFDAERSLINTRTINQF